MSLTSSQAVDEVTVACAETFIKEFYRCAKVTREGNCFIIEYDAGPIVKVKIGASYSKKKKT